MYNIYERYEIFPYFENRIKNQVKYMYPTSREVLIFR